ncbi:Uncharacterized protein PBTT_08360 [Plasmodiophora brassicae]
MKATTFAPVLVVLAALAGADHFQFGVGQRERCVERACRGAGSSMTSVTVTSCTQLNALGKHIKQVPNLVSIIFIGEWTPRCSVRNVGSLIHKIDASRTPTSDISALLHLTDLVDLDLSHSHVSGSVDVAKLSSLVQLDLSHTAITSLTGLGDLKNVNYLDASYTPLTSVSGLDQLDRLVVLDLSHTKLRFLRRVETLPNLAYVDLSHTRLRSASGLLSDAHLLSFLNLDETSIPERDTVPPGAGAPQTLKDDLELEILAMEALDVSGGAMVTKWSALLKESKRVLDDCESGVFLKEVEDSGSYENKADMTEQARRDNDARARKALVMIKECYLHLLDDN